MSVYDQPFENVLSTAQWINNITTSWTPEYVEDWSQTYPDSLNSLVMDQYGFCIVTHPGYFSATPEQQQQAQDIFRTNWETFGGYVDPQVASDQIGYFVQRHSFESMDSIVDGLPAENLVLIQPNVWSIAIGAAFEATVVPSHISDVTIEEASGYLRDLMETLNTATDFAGQPIDISQVVDMGYFDSVLQSTYVANDAALYDPIVDNLSGEAIALIQPSTWGQVIEAITSSPYYPPIFPEFEQVTVAESNAALRELMETLNTATDFAGQPIDISQIVDVYQIGNVLQQLGFNGNLGGIDAIVDNLSAQALTFIQPSIWSGVAQSIVDAPFFPSQPGQEAPTVEESNAALRELMETLNTATDFAGQPIDIFQVVDVYQIGNVLENLSLNGNFDGIDAIVDNLSDQAIGFVNSATWNSVIHQMVGSVPAFAETEDLNDALRDLMETLNTVTDVTGAPIDIAQIVDVHNVGGAIDALHSFGNNDGIAAIVENLSDIALDVLKDSSSAIADGSVVVGSTTGDALFTLYGASSILNIDVAEVILGLDGDDLTLGARTDTAIYGGKGDDTLYDFYGGNDTISGGDGSDTLYGGGGDDTFVFNEGETGVDHIIAFTEGDKIDVSDLLSGYDPLTDAIEDFIVITQVDDNNFSVSVDVDGAGTGSATEITSVNTSTGLDMNDFIITNDEIV